MKYYSYYCCTIGIIGAILTCFLLIRRLIKLREHKIVYKRLHKTKINYINKKLIKCMLDLKHNFTIYIFFIFINISDLLFIFNWLISNIEYKVTSNYNTITNKNLVNLTDTLKNQTTNNENDGSTVIIKLINTTVFCQLYNYLSTASLFGSFGYILACLIDRICKINKISSDVTIYSDDYFSYKNNNLKKKIPRQLETRLVTSTQTETTIVKKTNTAAAVSSPIKLSKNTNTTKQVLSTCELISNITNHNGTSHATNSNNTLTHAKSLTSQSNPLIYNLHPVLIRQLCNKYTSIMIFMVILIVNSHIIWLFSLNSNNRIHPSVDNDIERFTLPSNTSSSTVIDDAKSNVLAHSTLTINDLITDILNRNITNNTAGYTYYNAIDSNHDTELTHEIIGTTSTTCVIEPGNDDSNLPLIIFTIDIIILAIILIFIFICLIILIIKYFKLRKYFIKSFIFENYEIIVKKSNKRFRSLFRLNERKSLCTDLDACESPQLGVTATAANIDGLTGDEDVKLKTSEKIHRNSSSKSIDKKIIIKKYEFEFLFTCIITVGLLTLIFSLPSIISKSTLMIVFIINVSNLNESNLIDDTYIRLVADISDYFLLTLASHKFLIFLFKSKLIKLR